MTVKDLIEQLQAYSPDTVVYGCEPSDGNGPQSLIEAEVGMRTIESHEKWDQCPCGVPGHSGYNNRDYMKFFEQHPNHKCYKCMNSGKLWRKRTELVVGWC